jgi:transcriptional regulator with XRE-family HTH domain
MPRNVPVSPEQKKRILELRQKTHMTAQEIGDDVGLKEQTVRRIYRAHGLSPSPEVAARFYAENAKRLRHIRADPFFKEKHRDSSAWANRTEKRREEERVRMRGEMEAWKGKARRMSLGSMGGKARRDKGIDNGAGRYQRERFAWCPPEYRPLYDDLVYRKKVGAMEAMRLTITQMELDERRRVQRERDFVMGRRAS